MFVSVEHDDPVNDRQECMPQPLMAAVPRIYQYSQGMYPNQDLPRADFQRQEEGLMMKLMYDMLDHMRQQQQMAANAQ